MGARHAANSATATPDACAVFQGYEIMRNTRPFRFGVLGESIRTAAQLVATARSAESAGYATFLIRDHFVEEPFGHQLAPLTALADAVDRRTRGRRHRN